MTKALLTLLGLVALAALPVVLIWLMVRLYRAADRRSSFSWRIKERPTKTSTLTSSRRPGCLVRSDANLEEEVGELRPASSPPSAKRHEIAALCHLSAVGAGGPAHGTLRKEKKKDGGCL